MSLKEATQLIISQDRRNDAINRAAGLYFSMPDRPAMKDLEPLRQICEDDSDANAATVALIMMTTTAFAPESSWLLIECFATPFNDKLALRPDFILGTILGMFGVGTWLQANNSDSERYEESLSNVLVDIVRSDRLARDVKVVPKEFKGLLAEAVRDFRKTAPMVSTRMGHFRNLLIRLEAGFESDDEISELGKIIIDQLCYTEFKMMSTVERNRAINVSLDQLHPRPARVS